MLRTYQHVCCFLLGLLAVTVVEAQKEYYLLLIFLVCIPYDKLPRYVVQFQEEYAQWRKEGEERDEFESLEMGLAGRDK